MSKGPFFGFWTFSFSLRRRLQSAADYDADDFTKAESYDDESGSYVLPSRLMLAVLKRLLRVFPQRRFQLVLRVAEALEGAENEAGVRQIDLENVRPPIETRTT